MIFESSRPTTARGRTDAATKARELIVATEPVISSFTGLPPAETEKLYRARCADQGTQPEPQHAWPARHAPSPFGQHTSFAWMWQPSETELTIQKGEVLHRLAEGGAGVGGCMGCGRSRRPTVEGCAWGEGESRDVESAGKGRAGGVGLPKCGCCFDLQRRVWGVQGCK